MHEYADTYKQRMFHLKWNQYERKTIIVRLSFSSRLGSIGFGCINHGWTKFYIGFSQWLYSDILEAILISTKCLDDLIICQLSLLLLVGSLLMDSLSPKSGVVGACSLSNVLDILKFLCRSKQLCNDLLDTLFV